MKPPLEGIRVVDVSQFAAAPTTAAFLGDWGAEVIHVEHPIKGDGTRGVQSGSGQGIYRQASINYLWDLWNRNKKGMTVDIGKARGKEIMYKLIETADIFLSNMRPYEIEKFGLNYEKLSQINSKLIYANISGYGLKGSDRDGPGYDSCAFFARTGILHQLAEPGMDPAMSRPAMGDNTTGLACFAGIMVALYMRERTGIGQEVDVSLYNTGVWVLSVDVQGALTTGNAVQQERRKAAANPLRNHYKTKDERWLMLAMLQSDPYWSQVCKMLEREDLEQDSRFNSFQQRAGNSVELIGLLDQIFATKTLKEWKPRMEQFAIPWAPLQTVEEVINDPQTKANDFFWKFDHPAHGPLELVANPIKLSKTPPTMRMPGPEFSQHTEEILLELGYTWEDIDRFKELKVIA